MSEATHIGLELLETDIDYIVTSPFHRCYQTSLVIQNVFRQFGRRIEIFISNDICEYLGHQKTLDLETDVRELAVDSARLGETQKELFFRCRRFARGISENEKILVVTHRIVIDTLLQIGKHYFKKYR